MELISWVSLGISLAVPVGLLAGRTRIVAGIEKSVQHKFDKRIENLRTELRKSEEAFKSDLRSKEAEISALRDRVFGRRASRQALLDKRRIDAVERVWGAILALDPYKAVSASMATLRLDVVEKRIPQEPKLQDFFALITQHLPDGAKYDNVARNEQPFLSPLAWAYFAAYQAIVLSSAAHANLLKLGTEDASRLLNKEHVKDLLKAALPDQFELIEKNSHMTTYHYLLEQLEGYLLIELKKMLEGTEEDQADLAQSADIMGMVNKAIAAGGVQRSPEVEKSEAALGA